jgi:hypothetical protein
MIKKDAQFKWTYVEKESFKKLKSAIVVAPTLQSPDFSKYFLLFTFSSDHSLTLMLTQKDQEGNECPIKFMTMGLQGT